MTFSQVSGCTVGCSTSMVLSTSPAVLSLSLWHVKQYLVRVARSGDDGDAAGGAGSWFAAVRYVAPINTQTIEPNTALFIALRLSVSNRRGVTTRATAACKQAHLTCLLIS